MFKKLKSEEKYILLSIPIIFLLGSLFHFLYKLTGENALVSLFAPVNESVWEHNKMVVLPSILVWFGYYIFARKKNISKDKWFTSSLVSILTMLITIPLLYYFYTASFGVEILWVDILILLIANILGQLIGLHIYKYSNGIKWYIAVILLILIILMFAIFTYYPPHLPIFMDSITKTYGI